MATIDTDTLDPRYSGHLLAALEMARDHKRLSEIRSAFLKAYPERGEGMDSELVKDVSGMLAEHRGLLNDMQKIRRIIMQASDGTPPHVWAARIEEITDQWASCDERSNPQADFEGGSE